MGVLGLAGVVMVGMCSGLASMANKKQVKAAQQAEQVAVVQAKAAEDQQAKDFVAKVPELRKQIDELTAAILAEDFQKADALDAQVVIALNRVDRVPNLLERDELRMRLRTADAPLVARRAQAAIDAGELDKADKLVQELAKREYAGAAALTGLLVEKRASGALTTAEADAAAKKWVAADDAVSLVLAALKTAEPTEPIQKLTKQALALQKRVAKKAIKDRKAALEAAAEQEAISKKCGDPNGCIFGENNTLWRAYDANEVAADNRYKGRTIIVTGHVHSIDKSLFDSIVIRLRGPNPYMTMMLDIDKEQSQVAASLSKGSAVEVRCVGAGMIIGSPNLRDCWILAHSR